MPVKPFHLEDLRKIMIDQPDEKIDKLNDESWVNQADDKEMVEILKRGTDDLKFQVAETSTSGEVLTHLASEGSPARLYNERYYKALKEVARNLNTPPEALAHLARVSGIWSSFVRKEVVKNPNTPPEVLAHLAKDDEYSVREVVAKSPNTPPEVLAHLAKDDKLPMIREEAAKNPNTPPEIRAEIAQLAEIEATKMAEIEATQATALIRQRFWFVLTRIGAAILFILFILWAMSDSPFERWGLDLKSLLKK